MLDIANYEGTKHCWPSSSILSRSRTDIFIRILVILVGLSTSSLRASVTTCIHLFRHSKLIQNRNKVLFTELIFEQNIGCTIDSLWEYLWFEMWSDKSVLALVALHWRSSAYHFNLFSGSNSTTVGGGKIPLLPRNCSLVNFKLHNRCWTFLDSSRVEALSCQYWKDSQDVVKGNGEQ